MQTRKALKNLSKGEIQYNEVAPDGPLAQNASWLLERHTQREAGINQAKERHDIAASLPMLEVARQKLMQIVGERVLPDDTPIAMRFDVFHAIKQASRGHDRDIGLKKFSTHLERLWHEDPLGTLSAGALSRLRDHYQSQNPRSVVGEVTDTLVPKVAFSNLPTSQLTRIASEIDDQEDYDVAIVRHGLHRDDLKSIRARAFIRELVNRKIEAAQSGKSITDDQARTGSIKRNSNGRAAGRAAERVIKRIEKEAQFVESSDEEASDSEVKKDDENLSMGIDGTGVLPMMASCLKEQDEMFKWAAITGNGIPKEAVAPPGWEKTVKEMKDEPEIDNPWALAWWMKGKGYEPGGSDKESAGDECATEMPTLQPPDKKEGKTAQREYTWDDVVESRASSDEEGNQFGIVKFKDGAIGYWAYIGGSGDGPVVVELPDGTLDHGAWDGNVLGETGSLSSEEVELVKQKLDIEESELSRTSARNPYNFRRQYSKTAQTPYGMGWGAENLVEIASDALSEVNNIPELKPLIEQAVTEYSQAAGQQAPKPGSQEYVEALVGGMSNNNRLYKRIKDAMYKSMMQETEEQMVAQPPSGLQEETQTSPALVPATAAKKSEKPKEKEFKPEINEQQDSQLPIKPGDGLKVIKACAISSDHPLVDDGCDHFPLFNKEQCGFVTKALKRKNPPSWWLGSMAELTAAVSDKVKIAKELPPEFKKNILDMKDKGSKKKDKGSKKKDKGEKDTYQPPDKKEGEYHRAAARGFTTASVEEAIIGGKTAKYRDFSIQLADDSTIELSTKYGNKKYPMFDMDVAISDFMYLVDTEKEGAPPAPVFLIREGMRMTCPGCGETNSYAMPKEATNLSCGNCDTIFPSNVVTAAFNVGVAKEETTLVAFTPRSMQEEFGNKFAKAAEMIGADSMGAVGCKAEAYAVAPDDKKMAEVWDFLVEAGFKPLAQMAPPPAPSAPAVSAPAGGVMAQDEMLEMELEPEGPLGDPEIEMDMPISDVPDLGEPGGDAGWADAQMVQAAMMHYHAQGNNVIEAITQFSKDYGDGYDPETVMQVAATVYGIGLDQIKIGMKKGAGDLPGTNVNTQQSDAVSVGKGDTVLGPDSETHGDLKTPKKPKPQVKPQGQFADTNTQPETDSNDPGSFGAPKPKTQHPATDQKGVKLPSTAGPAAGLGADSETDGSGLMKTMDQMSSGAYNALSSK